MIPAIVLAAGASSRMGRTKALLPLPGGDTFLSRIVATLGDAGIAEVVAVIGYDAAAIREAIPEGRRGGLAGTPGEGTRSARLRLVENPDPSHGQLSSLLVGLDALLDERPLAVLVTTVDLPLVSADTVRRVLAAWASSRAPIVRPARSGRHGHPVVFGASLFGELRTADLRAGARVVVQAYAAEAVDVPVDDAWAFDDIDTPEDYARIVGESGLRPAPSEVEGLGSDRGALPRIRRS